MPQLVAARIRLELQCLDGPSLLCPNLYLFLDLPQSIVQCKVTNPDVSRVGLPWTQDEVDRLVREVEATNPRGKEAWEALGSKFGRWSR